MGFDIALSGIQAINQQLDTISHNIANAGTYGFKSSRANFSSLYAGSTPTGTEIGSLTQSIGQNGGTVSTGRGLDASINGRGFFVSKDNQGQSVYSRVGIFAKDVNGFLVNGAGQRVQGYPQKPPSTQLGTLGELPIPTGQIPAVATTKASFSLNVSRDWKTPVNAATFDPTDWKSFNMSKSTVLHDSLGGERILTQYFIKDDTVPDAITIKYMLDGVADPGAPDTTLTFAPATGQLASVTPPPASALANSVALKLTPAGGAAIGDAVDALVVFDYSGSTNFNGEATTAVNAADGYASGSYVGVELNEKGALIAKYTNGEKQSVGVLAIASFPDEGALTNISDTSWTANAQSGTPLYDTPGVGMAGALNVARLEQSNVDITSELVGLMTSQRNYQANSKVIQTQSAMMQSLMQAL
ncbi:flagellar hook protein FlgE [Rugamonas sp. CCM 8940]|uniref:flagellar hook protein FlgE n=1 Tax=Rugamonas sp. CCM 8940 TaxID=2765359 RepID=UPI0018F30396|nr:flagellar hook-basal body complex protein [Rugamonas sp. CCM 8940]MBJ7310702.1 flagellar hook-basal body complex protein [Rugamonas sp. CCM 8940]